METLGIDRTLEIADYIRRHFHNELSGQGGRTPFPKHWKVEQLQECDQLVDILVRAFLNRKTLTWSAKDYVRFLEEHGPRASGQNQVFEKKLSSAFPPLVPGKIVMEYDPFILCDIEGNILIWYLPGALKSERQDSMWKSLKIIQDSFVLKEYASSWRVNDRYYMKPEDCPTYPPGTVSLAPAWFQQAHSKSGDPLEVSRELRKARSLEWIEEHKESSALAGAALAIMHPDQFEAGVKVLRCISQDPSLVTKAETLPKVLEAWTSPLSGLSIINNRETPAHRDHGSAFPWLDVLTTVGPYDRGIMMFPGIGIEVSYYAGTMVSLAGRIISHSAKSRGERACIAYYMKEDVVGGILEGPVTWVNTSLIGHI